MSAHVPLYVHIILWPRGLTGTFGHYPDEFGQKWGDARHVVGAKGHLTLNSWHMGRVTASLGPGSTV